GFASACLTVAAPRRRAQPAEGPFARTAAAPGGESWAAGNGGSAVADLELRPELHAGLAADGQSLDLHAVGHAEEQDVLIRRLDGRRPAAGKVGDLADGGAGGVAEPHLVVALGLV